MAEAPASVTGALRVLLVEDHAMVRNGVRALLERAGIEVVGEARDGREAVRLAAALRPRLVILDVAMPEMNGIEAARAIREADRRVGIVMLSRSSISTAWSTW